MRPSPRLLSVSLAITMLGVSGFPVAARFTEDGETASPAPVEPARGPEGLASATCLGRPATIVASSGLETVGTRGAGVVTGARGGPNRLFGGAGADWLVGSAAGDLLVGGANGDSLIGRGGNDVLRGGHGRDELAGGDGDDQLRGGSGPDTLDAGSGRDLLDGQQGPDYLNARDREPDRLYGGRGRDDGWWDRGLDKVEGVERGYAN